MRGDGRPPVTGIHQYNDSLVGRDGIGNSQIFIQDLLRDMGFRSELYTDYTEPNLNLATRSLRDLDELAPTDLLLIHHSLLNVHIDRLAALNCRKAIVYHSITPPKLFPGDDHMVDIIRRGFAQIERFRDIVEASIAISPYNAHELRQRGLQDVTIIPLLRDFTVDRYKPHRKLPYYDKGAVFRLLFVGRITPHKCQHELIDAVATIGQIRQTPIELVLVGHAEHGPGYCAEIMTQIRRLGLTDRVIITGSVTDEELYGRFRAADAYVSFSEHEGFGIPLIEAMGLDVPVIAYAAAGTPGTLGNAGILIDDKSPHTLHEHLLRLHDDRLYRGELVRKQRERVLWYGRDRLHRELQLWLERRGIVAPPAHAVERGASSATLAGFAGTAKTRRNGAGGQTHYVVEGPFETSYSLANFNRQLARAMDQLPGSIGYIDPAEGTEDYEVDIAAAERLPPQIKELVQLPLLGSDRVVTIRQMYPPRPNGMLGDLRLIRLPWEESAIPGTLAHMINLHTEGVLVPSEFCKRVMRNSGVRQPIGVLSDGLEDLAEPVARATRGAPAADTPFTFLHISSGLPRKGIEELMTAYCLAFTAADPVLLIIKTAANAQNVVFDLLKQLGTGVAAPAIQVIDDDLDTREMELLHSLADAVVLPTRGEGFCLPAAEAMARGIPLIITGYSGQMDFCTPANALLLDYEFERSKSHVGTANSLWVRPSVPQLVEAMKTLYRDGRGDDTASARRAAAARRDVAPLTWSRVAGQLDNFVTYLQKRPAMSRKLRLAWVSTYNSRCGVATYSHNLIEQFDPDVFDISVLANNETPVGAEPGNLVRLWTDREGTLDDVRNYVLARDFDAVCIQFHFSFYDLGELEKLLRACQDAKIDTYLAFHRTKDHTLWGVSLREISATLARCTRLFVHGVEDVERLKAMGVIDNVVLIPHGVVTTPAVDLDVARTLLDLQRFTPVIGCFGFIAPPKGFQTLLHAFALVLRHHPDALLLMLTAENLNPDVIAERERCEAMIDSLGLHDNVLMLTEFIEDEHEVLLLLGACNAIVFPYQYSMEAASGAIRVGLASGRPCGCTPLPIFAEFSELVHTFDGIGPIDIANGIRAMLSDDYPQADVIARQRDWLRDHSFVEQARRVGSIIVGCAEERLGVQLRPPAPSPEAEATTPPRAPDRVDPGNSLREIIEAEFQPLQRRDLISLAFRHTLGREPAPQELAELEKLDFDPHSAADRWNLIRTVAQRGDGPGAAAGLPDETMDGSALLELDSSGLVDAAYQRVLLRDPRPAEREPLLASLGDGSLSGRKLIEDLLASSEFRRLARPLRVLWPDTAAPSWSPPAGGEASNARL